MESILHGWGRFMAWLLLAERTRPAKPKGIRFDGGEPRRVRFSDGRWAGKFGWLFPDGSFVPEVCGAANYWQRGTAKAYFVPTIATKAAPSAAEVNAGVDLTPKMADIAGFSFQNQSIPTPNWSTTFNSVIPGEDQVQASNITFFQDKVSNPIRTSLAKGTVGFIVLFFQGIAGATPAAGDKAEVWPVISVGPVRIYTMGNEAAKWRADLTPNDVPATDAVVA